MDMDRNMMNFEINDLESWRDIPSSSSNMLEATPYENDNNDVEPFGMSLRKRAKPIPMLRNGNCLFIRAIQLGGHRFSLHDTCGFDSVYQLLVSSCSDRAKIAEYMRSKATVNELFEMVLETLQFGLLHAYRERARILKKYFPVRKVIRGCEILACETNIGHLCNVLFETTPSITEITTCNKGCPSKNVSTPVIVIEDTKITEKSFAEVVYNELELGEKPCSNKGCDGIETTVARTGNMIIIEVYNISNDNNPVQINKLIKTIKSPNSDKDYHLVGLVEYRSPPIRRRKVDNVGHYVAFCNRLGGQWFEYDDLDDTPVRRSRMHKVNVSLLMYAYLE